MNALPLSYVKNSVPGVNTEYGSKRFLPSCNMPMDCTAKEGESKDPCKMDVVVPIGLKEQHVEEELSVLDSPYSHARKPLNLQSAFN